MGLLKKSGFGEYFRLKGRASRGEYWKFVGYISVIMFVVDFLASAKYSSDNPARYFATTVFYFVFLGPSICILVRRLHDIGKNGKWAWLLLVPLVGPIILLVFTLKKSQEGSNEFGPSPLELKAQAG
ncbi:MAG: DUF805 domain-containing protein [Klebsiella huaxiensis]|uniref:DUF805 domain-containing protein n=1 Tax=Klebsiella huaxiensis TaxID=2153354 RepID=UPI0026F1EE3A|nr:DUF805 domain-containing protein [Klebsiella huaxiensis]WEJ87427.1 MAG: DUF805 domain-containing protein [Klebsiella huaxiensis]